MPPVHNPVPGSLYVCSGRTVVCRTIVEPTQPFWMVALVPTAGHRLDKTNSTEPGGWTASRRGETARKSGLSSSLSTTVDCVPNLGNTFRTSAILLGRRTSPGCAASPTRWPRYPHRASLLTPALILTGTCHLLMTMQRVIFRYFPCSQF